MEGSGELQRKILNLESAAATAKEAVSSSGVGHEAVCSEVAAVMSPRERAGTFDSEFELRLGGDRGEAGPQSPEEDLREVSENRSGRACMHEYMNGLMDVVDWFCECEW